MIHGQDVRQFAISDTLFVHILSVNEDSEMSHVCCNTSLFSFSPKDPPNSDSGIAKECVKAPCQPPQRQPSSLFSKNGPCTIPQTGPSLFCPVVLADKVNLTLFFPEYSPTTTTIKNDDSSIFFSMSRRLVVAHGWVVCRPAVVDNGHFLHVVAIIGITIKLVLVLLWSR